MANILTVTEAATTLRVDETDPAMLDLLPQVDGYIKNATGHDWANDSTVDPVAKSAARMLIVSWYENPGMMGQGVTPLQFGLSAALVQLEAMGLDYRQVAGAAGAGGCVLPGARVGDTVASVTGLIGATGDQSAAFETVITITDQIQQVSTANLSGKYFRARLVSLGDL